ncbi:MAG: diacylglycerol kinase family protein [Sorangiineae bacterium]|nr:diacylglycerol kinase family protein [Polyangiaceae bacterium]MEB2321325.1 diacylglycerol kinase family protein [Sorangiineae bacterium]
MSIAVVVNTRARRGGQAAAALSRAALPSARILTSRSLEDTAGFVRELSRERPRVVISAGGDGTAIGLLNASREAARAGVSVPWLAEGGAPETPLGLLPLGTGNAWARVMGAPRLRRAVQALGSIPLGALPVKLFELLEIDGTLAHFAGTGWDAEMIDDFHEQKQAVSFIPRRMRQGLAGYLYGMFTRTIPRHFGGPRTEVELVNTGSDAYFVDDAGMVRPLPGGEHGQVLYRGPTSVCAAGTTPEWGFGFRAFPHAGRMPGRFCMRVYSGSAIEATLRMRELWRGAIGTPKMHSWLVDRCQATFSHPVPFQIGGDRTEHKTTVEYALASERVNLLDWRALGSA